MSDTKYEDIVENERDGKSVYQLLEIFNIPFKKQCRKARQEITDKYSSEKYEDRNSQYKKEKVFFCVGIWGKEEFDTRVHTFLEGNNRSV